MGLHCARLIHTLHVFGCSHELCCIQDADHVLWPKYWVVNPTDTTSSGSESTSEIAAADDSSSASTAGIEYEGGVGYWNSKQRLSREKSSGLEMAVSNI
jgi:hypothetical protein